ncbi:MAG: hypothetical protein KUG77_07185 [Nannocystaceae bacterium]|nr:hypothetical protein [Nannocystaceae bacterium]
MRTLFVAPMQRSSGEASTVVAMVRSLLERNHSAYVLASQELAGSIRARVNVPVDALGPHLPANQAQWRSTVDEFAPSHIVFADFPMLAGFSSGVAPLCTPSWTRQLMAMNATVFTLDHLGYGQTSMRLYFGPPHLCSQPVRIPELPEGMRTLLPCPVHDPGQLAGRRGTPFSIQPPPSPTVREECRERTRARFGITDGVMIVHCASQWAHRFCTAFDLSYYSILTRIWAWYFRDAPGPVTVISVNGVTDALIENNVRVVASSSLPEGEFSQLIASCDLFLNENPFSSVLGHTVSQGIPAACFVNSYRIGDLADNAPPALRALAFEMEEHRRGSVFPYRVFPLDFRAELETMQLFRANRFVQTFEELEVWGGSPTQTRLHDLLWDEGTQSRLRKAQGDYAAALAALPGPQEVLAARGDTA